MKGTAVAHTNDCKRASVYVARCQPHTHTTSHLVGSCLCLPYLNKAFTIDDPVYVLQAQQIRKAPLHPLALDICWTYDKDCGPVATQMVENVLMSYYLVPVAEPPRRRTACSPDADHRAVVRHCGYGVSGIPFRFLGTFAACAAGLLVAATPPVLAMASTAMPEISHVPGRDRDRAPDGVEGEWYSVQRSCECTGAGSSAPWLGYHLVFLWPIAAVLLRDDARIFDVRSWIALPKRRWIPLILAVSGWQPLLP